MTTHNNLTKKRPSFCQTRVLYFHTEEMNNSNFVSYPPKNCYGKSPVFALVTTKKILSNKNIGSILQDIYVKSLCCTHLKFMWCCMSIIF